MASIPQIPTPLRSALIGLSKLTPASRYCIEAKSLTLLGFARLSVPVIVPPDKSNFSLFKIIIIMVKIIINKEVIL